MQHKIKIPVRNYGQVALNFSLYTQKQINRFSFENIFILLPFLIEIYIKMITESYSCTKQHRKIYVNFTQFTTMVAIIHNLNSNSPSFTWAHLCVFVCLVLCSVTICVYLSPQARYTSACLMLYFDDSFYFLICMTNMILPSQILLFFYFRASQIDNLGRKQAIPLCGLSTVLTPQLCNQSP